MGSTSPLAIWDLEEERQVREFEGTKGLRFVDVVFSPNGDYVAIWTAGFLRLWNIKANKLEGDEDAYKGMAFSPNGSVLAYGSEGDVKFWKVPISKARDK